MTIAQSTKSRPFGTRFALISAVSLGLIGGPVALAIPADASTSLRGCTVDPLKPTTEHKKDEWKKGEWKKEVDFKIRIDCNGNKTVKIHQKLFKKDSHGRDLGYCKFEKHFSSHDGRVTTNCPCDVHKGDKVYHEVSFQVKTGNNWSDWTKWERSEVVTIH
ncbi:hypothetical protein [Arthrobacter sp. ISL-72]|uniref:hypothetical protein n=1 Tax=Arthrobacter sp. ISL-72 TaxID=2819114 RepID=UPI001BE80B83|nr:hypothetical protein [Arthrobacter sp. ISL-72]MBT2593781.1 hypothetical protein [Arthrobacter sp. ISL-72]